MHLFANIETFVRSSRLSQFVGDEAGAVAIEYALIASLIALALVAALTALGGGLSSEFVEVSGALK